MILNFNISKKGITKANHPKQINWIVLKNATKEETQKTIDQFDLPNDIFIGSNQAEEVSRFEKLKDTNLNNSYSLVLINLSANTKENIEFRLEPISFVISDSLLITYVCENSEFTEHLVEQRGQEITNLDLLISFAIFTTYTHFIKELQEIKKTIDDLDQAARKTTENSELFRLADTERKIVYLDHTLQDQAETLDSLWEEKAFISNINDEALIYDIKLSQRHANKLVRVYRDLLETIGGLFTDMMDNNLNHLMKFLDSAGLVISIPALISGIWGMNTGGIPGKSSSFGFLIVMSLATLLTIITAIHLKKKDYSK
ncbi:magnesium transporter CorA family protein [Pediococcus parvulus]|nr:magnesium transporter CorA family protein [Pediococcus parvulus]MCT3030403.1 magnesium transporter CorA family protein [Pediococcus parvulus]